MDLLCWHFKICVFIILLAKIYCERSVKSYVVYFCACRILKRVNQVLSLVMVHWRSFNHCPHQCPRQFWGFLVYIISYLCSIWEKCYVDKHRPNASLYWQAFRFTHLTSLYLSLIHHYYIGNDFHCCASKKSLQCFVSLSVPHCIAIPLTLQNQQFKFKRRLKPLLVLSFYNHFLFTKNNFKFLDNIYRKSILHLTRYTNKKSQKKAFFPALDHITENMGPLTPIN